MASSSSDMNLPSTAGTSSPNPAQNTTNQLQEKQSLKSSGGPGERPLADVISEQFPSFDAQSVIVKPFENEAARDAAFEQELSGMLLNVILETHAWAAARPKHEAALESQKLEDEMAQIMDIEREQEQTRERLGEFVRKMKTALAALTGTSF